MYNLSNGAIAEEEELFHRIQGLLSLHDVSMSLNIEVMSVYRTALPDRSDFKTKPARYSGACL